MSVTIHTWGDAWPMAFYFNCKCGNVSLDGRTAPRTAAMDTFRRGLGGGNVVRRMGTQQQQVTFPLRTAFHNHKSLT